MARMTRVEVFSPDEVAVVHVMNRVVRRCFLLGEDATTGKNYDYRKPWIEELFRRCSACFGIDLLAFAILSNHFHAVLRSRPDVVVTWDDTEVARRWLLLCPFRKQIDGTAAEPTETELNTIRNDADRVAEIRSRLSDISWWMRLICQRIASRANAEDDQVGKFWQSRFRAVRLLDEAAVLACTAYVDLNPIRADVAERLEDSDFTSVQRRIQSQLEASAEAEASKDDGFLARLPLGEATGPCASTSEHRCSDKGFLAMTLEEYLQLLDWTAREVVLNKPGVTPAWVPPILSRLSLEPRTWCALVSDFGRLFFHVAGHPATVDRYRSPARRHRFHLRSAVRHMWATAP